MVNDEARIAERALALGYAPAHRRTALVTLFALDARLRAIALAAREPMIGLMRLTWWRDALERLDDAPAPAEPLLRAVQRDLLPGVSGASLARLTEAWDALLSGDVNWSEVARARGDTLFPLAAVVLGADDARVPTVGAAWARIDLARDWPAGLPDGAMLAGAYRTAWPRALRPLGALGLLARADLDAKSRPASPARIARLLAHRLTGR